METPYKAISFEKHDVVTRPVLDQLNANYRWILENTPRGRFYRDNAEPRPENINMIAGKAVIKQNNKSDKATVGVQFAKAFAPNCNPSISTGVVADFQRKIFCVVNGPGGATYPTANGFQISINIDAADEKQDYIKKDFVVHWIALGFRRDDMNEF